MVTSAIKDLMQHIKDIHGSEPCKLFAQNKCAQGFRCWFSHNIRQPKRQSASFVKDQDFQETPTRRLYSSVVGAQTSQLHKVSQQDQQSIQSLTSQMGIMMNQMNHIQAILAAMN